jgi:hypothetical protein
MFAIVLNPRGHQIGIYPRFRKGAAGVADLKFLPLSPRSRIKEYGEESEKVPAK